MLMHKERLTGSTASGALTLTTSKFSGSLCKQIYIAPAIATTTYNVAITDPDSDTVFEELSFEGTLNRAVDFPLIGIYSIAITSSSADEAFTTYLSVQEKS